MAERRISARFRKDTILLTCLKSHNPGRRIRSLYDSAHRKEVFMTDLENMDELEADYGPPAPFAEHRISERVTYQLKEQRFTGTIVYVAAPRVIAGKQIPTTYVIVRDDYEGVPDEVC